MIQNKAEYINGSSTKKLFKDGFNKLLVEITSVKFLLMCFICVGISFKWIGDTVGLGAALVIIGVREVPVEAIMSKLTGKLGS